MVEEDAVLDTGQTRVSRRTRTKTYKALELETRKHSGKPADRNLFGELSQGPSTAKDGYESNESDASIDDEVIGMTLDVS